MNNTTQTGSPDLHARPQPKYWFRRRTYGYGWTPKNKYGWSVTVIFLVYVFAGAILLYKPEGRGLDLASGLYLIGLFVLAIAMAYISYRKGPSPKWQWGSAGEKEKDR